MARRWYGRDRGLTTRMYGTMFGLGLIYVVFIAVVIALGVNAVFVLLLAGGFAVLQLFFSDKIALAAMRAAQAAEPTPPAEVTALAERRDAARLQKNWAVADALREQIEAQGWQVQDTPEGSVLQPL